MSRDLGLDLGRSIIRGAALVGLLLSGLATAGCSRPAQEAQEPSTPLFYGTLTNVNGRAAATDKVELTLWPKTFRVVAACGVVADYVNGGVTQVHESAPAIGRCVDQDLQDLQAAEAVVRDNPRLEYEAGKRVTLRGRSGDVVVFDRTIYMDGEPE